MSRFRLTTAGLLFAAVLAACTSTGASPTAEAEPTTEATATAEPEATATPEETAGAEPTLEEGAGDLASVLPDEVGGITIEYQSASGEQAFGSEGMTPEARAFLEAVGGDASNISSAFGFGFNQETGAGLSIVAFRISGADEGRLRDEFRAVMEQEGTEVITETSLGGKDVLAFGPAESEPSGFMYVKDDTVFIVGGSPPELMEEAISALP